MPIRAIVFELEHLTASVDRVGDVVRVEPGVVVGTFGPGSGGVPMPAETTAFEFTIPVGQLGLPLGDRRLLAIAAAAANCHLRELVLITGPTSPMLEAAEATGVRVVVFEPDHRWSPASLSEAIEALLAEERALAADVGVGPHDQPWPEGDHLDPRLLASGDRRNVLDRYRYWSEDAIIADLDAHRQPLHIAVENWQHDLNIGTVVRNANAFNVAGVHIVGRRRWNRRGAMATDRYLSVTQHATVDDFAEWAAGEDLQVVGIDNVPGARSLETEPLPRRAVLVFGQEGPGLSAAMIDACQVVCEIPQHGSTRSLNAGVASGIAMYAWAQAHGPRLAP